MKKKKKILIAAALTVTALVVWIIISALLPGGVSNRKGRESAKVKSEAAENAVSGKDVKKSGNKSGKDAKRSGKDEKESKTDEKSQENSEKKTENKVGTGENQDPSANAGSTSNTQQADQTPAQSKSGIVIVIDPGHQSRGDSNTEPVGPGSGKAKARVTGGTRGTTTGIYEYQLTMTMAGKIRDELTRRGYTVYLTRESNDVNISNAERAEFSNSKGADAYIRLHANGAGSSAANGAMTLYPTPNNAWVGNLSAASKSLSLDVLNSYCAATGMRNLGLQPRDDMTGFNYCKSPMTLIEFGFMTNPSDDSNMANASFQNRMAAGVADGIDTYFGR